ncbi:MAG TPA: hypothetical protein DCM54_15630 [Gammaproteobacteria bacterium]|nr:hypothetical protein [Gammaproteobacteria bacterium]|tara:strand:+ start:2670 stop:2990 length:321 start_codon:yes stop_codon:yes gene_type:complete
MGVQVQNYEFGYMSKREKLKLLLLKFLSLCWVTWTAFTTIYGDRLSLQFYGASGVMCGAYFYMNLFFIKSEVMELFELPYPVKGQILAYLAGIFLLIGIYYQVNWQ